MKGSYTVLIQNNKLRYEFTINRNITIIRGDSSTGKTTILNMLNEYITAGRSSGIQVKCDKTCRILSGMYWKSDLSVIKDSLVFIDECNDFVYTNDFAKAVKASDCYFIIITREDLPNLPYSVNEVYGLRVSNKYAGIKQCYNEMFRLYGEYTLAAESDTNVIIVEDSNSGYDFFKNIAAENKICISAQGKSNIYRMLQERETEKILVIADGAAFGCEMEHIYQLIESGNNIALYLPESFEWLVLKSGVIEGMEAILDKPGDFIESSQYVSWERFFTDILVQKTKGTYLQYSKKKINPVYLSDKIKNEIIKVMEHIKI